MFAPPVEPLTSGYYCKNKDIRYVPSVEGYFILSSMIQKIKVPPHKFVEKVFRIDGRVPDFDSFFYMKDLFDLPPQPTLLYKTARQVAKSTFEAIEMSLWAMFKPFFSIIHVSPSERQMRQFVDGKLNPIINQSPLVKSFVKRNRNSVTYKEFKNESKMFLRFAKYNADSIRGLSADAVFYDEVQDILWDVIPIINECMAQSSYGYILYAGTPKTKDNVIEFLWLRSKQYVWAVPCQSCGKWLEPADEDTMLKMLGKEGPICPHCGASLYPPAGKWVALNPEGKYPGFHVPQIIRHHKDPQKRAKQWREVLEKYETYPRTQFLNEVLGLSVEQGLQPISRADIEAAKYELPMTIQRTPEYKLPMVFMGIDWGITAERSFTVVTIGGFDLDGQFKVIYAKRFHETDILSIIDQIVQLVYQAGVSFIGADFGAGATNNQLIRQKLGDPSRVVEFVYTSQTEWVKRKTPLKFSLDRTQTIDRIVVGIKHKRIRLPRDIGELANDLLALREELSPSGKKVYIHNPNEPDDFVHSLAFCYTIAVLHKNSLLSSGEGLNGGLL